MRQVHGRRWFRMDSSKQSLNESVDLPQLNVEFDTVSK